MLSLSDSNDPEFYDAFFVRLEDDESRRIVDDSGKPVARDYLLKRWRNGSDAGFLRGSAQVIKFSNVWSLPLEDRVHLCEHWTSALRQQDVEPVYQDGVTYNELVSDFFIHCSSKNIAMLQQECIRIIGSTTTKASDNAALLQHFKPDIIIVEEAAEVFESNIISSLISSAAQMILIGDHQ